MKHWIRGTLAVVFALAVYSAYAQASRFVGSWTVDVQGSPRQRAMVITQEGETLHVSWGWKDQAKLLAVESSLDSDGTLTVTTRTDAVIVVHISDDDTLRGKFTTSAGKVLSATALRSTGAAQTSAPQLAAATPVSNTSQAVMPISFQPYQLVGDWNFVNSNTGNKYGGNIEVDVKAMDSKGTMHGLISYDGRQTNDKCGTKPLFTDKPVEAEIVKSANDYRIAFQVNCSNGASPRLITWTLTCDDKGDCTEPEVAAWGRGRKLLREVRK